MSNDTFEYLGSELELFATARHWKTYLKDQLAPHLGQDVLEVGAGLGGTTALLAGPQQRRWVCLEPDPALAERITAAIAKESLPEGCTVRVGTLAEAPELVGFDTILYIDVLEHIEADREELAIAAERLRPGGRLVVLSPAHQWLFSPFDAAIGHYRRYDRRSLERITPSGARLVSIRFLDSVGMLASSANRLVLKSAHPTPAQIHFWDSTLVPISRRIDPWFGHRLGKSILAVWEMPSSG
ncbi:MAG: class I SAM-dependent methyltransferase [Candidatus Sericytochromatia bacterium]